MADVTMASALWSCKVCTRPRRWLPHIKLRRACLGSSSIVCPGIRGRLVLHGWRSVLGFDGYRQWRCPKITQNLFLLFLQNYYGTGCNARPIKGLARHKLSQASDAPYIVHRAPADRTLFRYIL